MIHNVVFQSKPLVKYIGLMFSLSPQCKYHTFDKGFSSTN